MRTTYAGKHECLGNGAINVQLGYNKRREEHTISAKIVDCTTKDSEIIPFDPNPEVNADSYTHLTLPTNSRV